MRNKYFGSEQSSVLRTTLMTSNKANQSCTAVMGEGNSALEQLSKDQVTIRKKVKTLFFKHMPTESQIQNVLFL